MKILVCNAGSTSLKFKLYDMPGERMLAKCGIASVGSGDRASMHYINCLNGARVDLDACSIPTYREGIRLFLDCLTSKSAANGAANGSAKGTATGVIASADEIDRVGFKPTLSKGHYGVHEMKGEVLQGMRDWFSVSPVHNGAYLAAVEVVGKALPKAMLVGCFETDFHRTIPLERKLYGVPYEWYGKLGIQRLGYHGASHSYIASRLDELGGGTYRAISCHLGGSGSVCAIRDGRSVDTSFGMSLESGLMHVNRVGDMDCEIMSFLKEQGLSDDQITEGLQKKGGILGIAGIKGGIEDVVEAAKAGDARAKLALDAYASGIAHYIGAFYVDLGGLDYLVFTAGIGENSDYIRALVCEKVKALGVKTEPSRNAHPGADGVVSADDSAVKVLVIPTDEELVIARKTFSFSTAEPDRSPEPSSPTGCA